MNITINSFRNIYEREDYGTHDIGYNQKQSTPTRDLQLLDHSKMYVIILTIADYNICKYNFGFLQLKCNVYVGMQIYS